MLTNPSSRVLPESTCNRSQSICRRFWPFAMYPQLVQLLSRMSYLPCGTVEKKE